MSVRCTANFTFAGLLLAAGGMLAISAPSALRAPPAGDEFLLIRRGSETQTIRLASITQQQIEFIQSEGGWASADLHQCIAVIAADRGVHTPQTGMLTLADGQRLPGEAMAGSSQNDGSLLWNHIALGRVRVPLDRIASVAFAPGAPTPISGDLDIIVLANGDRVEGLIRGLDDPIRLDVDMDGASQPTEIPRERVASVTLVTPPQHAAGQRLWFADGTILDVQHVTLGDDGFLRLGGVPFAAGPESITARFQLNDIAAVLFDPKSLTALAELKPRRIEGPPTRYTLPPPQIIQPGAPLGLSDVVLRGPIKARYSLSGARYRFAAEVRMPAASQTWGDCELLIYDGDSVIYRTRLSHQSPSASFNIPVRGQELTIEIAEGANGPVGDTVVLVRALLLADSMPSEAPRN